VRRLFGLISAAGDRVNPVAVKEFRQAVQSRWVIAVVMLYLMINLSIVGGYLMLNPDADTSMNAGRGIFMWLLGILLLACIGFVPLYSGVRLSLERNDTNIDLLFVTTITPGTIIRGKYLAAMALTMLMCSVCMPFMILTYLLRGIDLPTIFGILAFALVICAAANVMGIFAGSVSGSWLMRGLVDAGVLFYLFMMFVTCMSMFGNAIMFGWGTIFSRSQVWQFIGSWLGIEALAIGLLYVLSVAMLSPTPSNRMLIPRLYLTISWAVTAAVACVWCLAEKTLAPIGFWMLVSGTACIIMAITSLGERDTWSARVRRTIPRSILLRPLAFLFYTGSAGGMTWCTLMFTATMLVADAVGKAVGPISGDKEFWDICSNMPVVFGFILCYCLMTAFFRITVLRGVSTSTLSVVAAFFGVLVCLVPYMAAFFIEKNWWVRLPWYLLGSPVVLTLSSPGAKDAARALMLGWLMVCVLLASPWAIGQWRRFTPYEAAKP
jgi:hypothetical protein